MTLIVPSMLLGRPWPPLSTTLVPRASLEAFGALPARPRSCQHPLLPWTQPSTLPCPKPTCRGTSRWCMVPMTSLCGTGRAWRRLMHSIRAAGHQVRSSSCLCSPNRNCGPNCCWCSSRQQLHLLLLAATKQQHVGTLLVLSPRQQPHTTPQSCSRPALLRPCPVCVCDRAERLSSSSGSGHQQQQQQGEPFMVAVQAVPSQFFQEGFFDDW